MVLLLDEQQLRKF